MAATLKELARKARDGSATLTQAVNACIRALRVSGVECDHAMFLRRGAAAGVSSTLGPRLWFELGAHRSARKPKAD